MLCTSALLVLCCDRFDRGSRQVKRDPGDLVTVGYDITLCWQRQQVMTNKHSYIQGCAGRTQAGLTHSFHALIAGSNNIAMAYAITWLLCSGKMAALLYLQNA